MIIKQDHRFSAQDSHLERDAAFDMARRGFHVLPVRQDKSPLTPHGVYDATANQDRIADWWERHPAAGVAIRTGQVSNVVALDLDTQNAITEALRKGLPDDTDVVRTRRGWHWLFHAPDEPLPSCDLFPGMELKAENVYCVAPPSMHPSGRRYRLIPSPTGRLAELPQWVHESLAELREADSSTATAISLEPDGEPIPQGQRNRTLFKIACSLRARGADYAVIAAHLTAANAVRCTLPLEHREVDQIARSACRYPPGTTAPNVSDEVHEALDTYVQAVYGSPWPGKAGKTDRDVLLTLIAFARKYGVLIPTGVRVSVSFRDLARAAGIASSDTLGKSIHRRLKTAGWLRPDNADRKARDAGAFVLLEQRPNPIHTTIVRGANLRGQCVSVTDIPRLRHSGIGKKSGHILDTLRVLDSSATVTDVAAAMHETRPDRLRREYVLPLAAAGLVDFDAATDVVALPDNWQQNLYIERGLRGEVEREERQKLRHEEERQRFHGECGGDENHD